METKRDCRGTRSERGRYEPMAQKSQSTGNGSLALPASTRAQPKLSPEQRAHLPALLSQGAEGFRGEVWTTHRADGSDDQASVRGQLSFSSL